MYRQFENALKPFAVFSLKEVKKIFPQLDKRRFTEWQKKGYIQKLKRGFYAFTGENRDEHFLNFAANKIYNPSYVSLESALSHYAFIPEGVFTITSVTTRNTARYHTPAGNFVYKHIKPELFFGYRLIQTRAGAVKMAEPEKALLDFFYSKKISTLEDLESARFNIHEINEVCDFLKLKKYLEVYQSAVMNKRVKLLKELIYAEIK